MKFLETSKYFIVRETFIKSYLVNLFCHFEFHNKTGWLRLNVN